MNAPAPPLAAPWRVDLNLTHRCNLACRFCYYYAAERQFQTGEDDLPTDVWLRFLRELESLQVLTVGLCGGEAVLYEGFPELLAFLAGSRMRFALYSNGTTIGRRLARELSGTRRCAYVQISLDGWRDAHEAMRGDGVWDQAVAAIGRLREAGVPVHVNTVLTRDNMGGMETFVRFVLAELGVRRLRLNPVVTEDRRMVPSEESLMELARRLRPLAEEFPALCRNRGLLRLASPPPSPGDCYGMLRRRCAVRADGALLPCMEGERLPMGRIQDGRFLESWRSPEWEAARRRVLMPMALPVECAGCAHHRICSRNCLGRTGREWRFCYRRIAEA